MDDAEAERLVAASFPVYYITGAIHSPETGSPTALMELAYRLAVDESPYVRFIRDHVVTLITPVVEVDGRDRQVDVYNWHLAHPKENWPPLVYWGHYVAHDNNRDAMGLTLALTRNVLGEYLFQKAQVLHDLHESVPFLYDNTVGDGPYNAWLDPILTNEWQMIGWNNVQQMTSFGMPGVFTHGDFDTWSPGYLMFLAASHNGISRLYETFGNAGRGHRRAAARPRRLRAHLVPPEPAPAAGELVAAEQQQLPADRAPRLTALLRAERADVPAQLLPEEQAVDREAEARGTRRLRLPRGRPAPRSAGGAAARAAAPGRARSCARRRRSTCRCPFARRSKDDEEKDKRAARAKPRTETRRFPAGSYLVRMDQPYSRVADMLLDYQYWSPDDPQKRPYDDTGWTFGELFGVQVTRVADPAVLAVAASRVSGRGLGPFRRHGLRARAGREPQRRHRAGHAPLSLQGRGLRGGGGALRGGGREVRARLVPHPRPERGRRRSRRLRAGPQDPRPGRRPEGQDASAARAPRRPPAQLAEHAGRGLVADGPRQARRFPTTTSACRRWRPRRRCAGVGT